MLLKVLTVLGSLLDLVVYAVIKCALKHQKHLLKSHVLQQITLGMNVISMGGMRRDKITLPHFFEIPLAYCRILFSF